MLVNMGSSSPKFQGNKMKNILKKPPPKTQKILKDHFFLNGPELLFTRTDCSIECNEIGFYLELGHYINESHRLLPFCSLFTGTNDSTEADNITLDRCEKHIIKHTSLGPTEPMFFF